MKRFVGLAVVLSVAMFIAIAVSQDAQHGNAEPPALGIHWAKGAGPSGNASSTPDMSYNGGPVLTSTNGIVVVPIFWGKGWSNPGDKISGIQAFYGGYGNTTYADASTEYTDSTGTHVGANVSYGGSVTDLSKASGGNRTSAILAEVCRVIGTPQSNAFYPVYTDLPRQGGYCAYHSWGTCNGVNVQFGFFWKLDGDAGCDPQSSQSYSQGLAALANVSAHELSETVTDPRGTGWFDASGNENGDKCAWTFPPTDQSFGGKSWKLQGEWSNNAYDTGSGYPNNSGQHGCIPTK